MVGKTLSHYHILREIGRGGNGRQVYEAEDTKLHRRVALKVLPASVAGDPESRERFEREARAVAALNHPYVVQVFDVGEQDGTPFIAMEYIRGEELNQLCRRGLAAGAFLPLRHAVELCRQAAMALGYIHALRDAAGEPGIVHCDVSPPTSWSPRTASSRSSTSASPGRRGQERRDEPRVRPGKLSYMSPEQAGASRSITAPTSARWAWCCTRCSRDGRSSPARP